MTLYGLFASLAWTATAVLFVERGHALVSRMLDQRERETGTEAPVEIPDDLMALALSEDGGSDEATKQAQQSVMDAVLDAYRRLKDWNKVRTAMGVGTI